MESSFRFLRKNKMISILLLIFLFCVGIVGWKYFQHLQMKKLCPAIPSIFDQFMFVVPFRIPFIQELDFDEFPKLIAKSCTGKVMTKLVVFNEMQVLLNDPDLVRDVFVKRAKQFDKTPDYEGFDVFGPNILSTNGKTWVKHRALCNMGFTAKHYEFLAQATNDSSNLMFQQWSTEPSTRIVNVTQSMADISFDILGKTVFGKDFKTFSPDREPLSQILIDSLNKDLIYRMVAFSILPTYFARSKFFSETKNFKLISKEIDKLLENKKNSTEHSDLLSLLLRAMEDSSTQPIKQDKEEEWSEQDYNKSFTLDEIKSDIYIFLLAGFETVW